MFKSTALVLGVVVSLLSLNGCASGLTTTTRSSEVQGGSVGVSIPGARAGVSAGTRAETADARTERAGGGGGGGGAAHAGMAFDRGCAYCGK